MAPYLFIALLNDLKSRVVFLRDPCPLYIDCFKVGSEWKEATSSEIHIGIAHARNGKIAQKIERGVLNVLLQGLLILIKPLPWVVNVPVDAKAGTHVRVNKELSDWGRTGRASVDDRSHIRNLDYLFRC